MSADITAKARGDLMITQIDVGATRRADGGTGGGTDFLLSGTFETMDLRAVLAIPKAFETSKKVLGLPRQYRFPRPDRLRFLRPANVKVAPALTAKRALGRRIFHLLKAAMGTPQADLGRRLGHGLGEAGI